MATASLSDRTAGMRSYVPQCPEYWEMARYSRLCANSGLETRLMPASVAA